MGSVVDLKGDQGNHSESNNTNSFLYQQQHHVNNNSFSYGMKCNPSWIAFSTHFLSIASFATTDMFSILQGNVVYV